MTRTIGRVDFTARIDGRQTPKDAENIGRKAGESSAKGYDETWSKGYEDSLTKAGKDALQRWRKNGQNDGTIYGQEIGKSMKKFLAQARSDVANLRMKPGFLDDFSRSFDDAGLAARAMQDRLIELNRSGELSGQVFDASRKQVDEWVVAQREAAIASNDQRDALAGLNDHIRSSKIAFEDATVAVEKHRKTALAGLKDDLLSVRNAYDEQNAAIEKHRRDAMAGLGMDLLNQKQLYDDVKASMRANRDEIDKATESSKKLGFTWGDIGHNGRQVILISAAIAAGAQEIAVLGSAAGAGIFALGGALTSLAGGAGGAAAIFSVLAKDIGSLPPELRSTASQFKALGTELGNTRDLIATAGIAEMPNTFARLRDTVSDLGPAFSTLGTAAGSVMDDFSKSVSSGSDGFRELNELTANAAADFPKLATATGTWARGLLRGLNEANPLTDQLIGYVQTLGDRFEDFTRSASFDQWIANASTTFTAFGGLLDATGRALNDLVTPESTVRTQEFLNNLTDFMPHLENLLAVIGELDVFGLLAQGLAEFGDALAPLAEPALELAGSLNDVASIMIGTLAGALGIVVDLATPVVQVLADIVGAVPPGVLTTLALGVVGVATAFGTLNAVSGIASAAQSLGIFAGVAETTVSKTGKLGDTLKSGLGKAGMAGLAIAGAAGLAFGLDELSRAISNVEGRANELVATNASFADSFEELSAKGLVGKSVIEDMDASLSALGENDFALGARMDDVANDAKNLKAVLGELDAPLATLAQTDLSQAVGQFSSMAKEVGASDEQVGYMLERMPEFSEQLTAAAAASGEMATKSDLISIALGETTIGMQGTSDALDILASRATLSGSEIDALAGKIGAFGEKNLTARDAARTYESAIDELTASVAENGTVLDITTEQGRANEAALDALATATLDLSAKTLAQTGEQSSANAMIAAGREELIKQLDQFGITGAEAQAYADKLGLIPADVSTFIKANGLAEAYKQTGELKYRLESINGSVYSYQMRGEYIQVGNREVGPPTAIGGTFYGAQNRLIAEAGPEAVVPLNRPLSMVEPSVRFLSAVAQGLVPPSAPSADAAPQGPRVNFEPGSIVVHGGGDPRRAAIEVANEIAETVGS